MFGYKHSQGNVFIERQLIYLLAVEIIMFPAESFSNRKQLLLLDRRMRQLYLLETSIFRDFEYQEQSLRLLSNLEELDLLLSGKNVH
jgi:hypothetical protein